jgi:uncharacterized cofD-like protein
VTVPARGHGPGSTAGPVIVAIGGGHGLATTLAALRPHAGRLTAVVSTADDGGSTGKLRASWDVPAPGDVRRCLSALGDERSLWARLLERRFDAGELEGHAVGNLLLLALTEELGSLQGASDELARLCGLGDDRVRVVPVTDDPVVLCGSAGDRLIEGQVAVAETVGVDHVWVDPAGTCASRLAEHAILDAQQVVLGPGSLYTSVLAAAVVGDIRKAICKTDAQVVYVANLRAEVAEARGYDLADHVAALHRHGITPHLVLAQDPAAGGLPLDDLGRRLDQGTGRKIAVVTADLARPHGLSHDPTKLGSALAGLLS